METTSNLLCKYVRCPMENAFSPANRYYLLLVNTSSIYGMHTDGINKIYIYHWQHRTIHLSFVLPRNFSFTHTPIHSSCLIPGFKQYIFQSISSKYEQRHAISETIVFKMRFCCASKPKSECILLNGNGI